MRNFIVTFLLAMISLTASAQIPFNGLVVDVAGKPIKKVRVWADDPNAYATTDKKGRFGFSDQPASDTLYVKYQKEIYSIPLEGRKSIKITLVDTNQPKSAAMTAVEAPELMDLGYGYVSRRERMNASEGITGAQLKATGAHDILNGLKGLVPGLEITPDGRAIIRGVKSFLSSSEPLYMVDGVQVADFNGININDVESVEVLKDAAIYGSRGANGAILVTTKRGR